MYARFSEFSEKEGTLINKKQRSIKKRDLRESKTSFFLISAKEKALANARAKSG